MVEVERLTALGEELSTSVPADIQEANEVLKQKESIVNQAYLEAQRVKESAGRDASDITTAAQQEHEAKVAEAEVLRVAEEKARQVNDEALQEAQQIVQEAQRQAYRIMDEAESAANSRREGADQYTRETLFNLEERLSELVGQVRRGIDALNAEAETAEVQVPAA